MSEQRCNLHPYAASIPSICGGLQLFNLPSVHNNVTPPHRNGYKLKLKKRLFDYVDFIFSVCIFIWCAVNELRTAM